jgi:SAM-dependent methyltransferase
MGQQYSQSLLNKNLNKLRNKYGRFNLSQRYYRDTENIQEHLQINNVLKHFNKKIVLDVGCHVGYYSVLISSFAKQVIGIDINNKALTKADYFIKLFDSNNIIFKYFSVFDIDDKFMTQNNVNAVFIHKTVGDVDSNQSWSQKNFNYVFLIFSKFCDTIICNDVKRIKEFFNNGYFSIQQFPSFRKNSLFLIKKIK